MKFWKKFFVFTLLLLSSLLIISCTEKEQPVIPQDPPLIDDTDPIDDNPIIDIIKTKKTGSLNDGFTINIHLSALLDPQPAYGYPEPFNIDVELTEYYYLGDTLADFQYHSSLTVSSDVISKSQDPNLSKILTRLFGVEILKDQDSLILEAIVKSYNEPLKTNEIFNRHSYYELDGQNESFRISPFFLIPLYETAKKYSNKEGQDLNQAQFDLLHDILNNVSGIDLSLYEKALMMTGEIKLDNTITDLLELLTNPEQEEPTETPFDTSSLPFTDETKIKVNNQIIFERDFLSKIVLCLQLDGAYREIGESPLIGKTNTSLDISIAFGQDDYVYLAPSVVQNYTYKEVTGGVSILTFYVGEIFWPTYTVGDLVIEEVGLLIIPEGTFILYDVDQDGAYDYRGEGEILSDPLEIIQEYLTKEHNIRVIDSGFDLQYSFILDDKTISFTDDDVITISTTDSYHNHDLATVGQYQKDDEHLIYLYDLDNDGEYDIWGDSYVTNGLHAQSLFKDNYVGVNSSLGEVSSWTIIYDGLELNIPAEEVMTLLTVNDDLPVED